MDIISRRERQLITVQRVRGGMMKGGNFNTWFAEIFVQFKGYSLGKLYSNGWMMSGGITAGMVEGLATYFPPCKPNILYLL